MILRKKIVDGKEIFTEISKEEAKKLYNKETLIFTTEDEEDDFIDEMEGYDEDELDEEDVKTEKTLYENLDNFFSNLGTKIENTVNGITNKFGTKNKKANKISEILPYLDEEELHTLVEKILDNDEEFKDISLKEVLPFLSEEDCDKLFVKSLMEENGKIKSQQIIPYVSVRCLDKVVDMYVNGEIKINNVNMLYPFLSKKSIKKLFDFIISSKN